MLKICTNNHIHAITFLWKKFFLKRYKRADPGTEQDILVYNRERRLLANWRKSDSQHFKCVWINHDWSSRTIPQVGTYELLAYSSFMYWTSLFVGLMTAVLQFGVLQSAWLFGKPPFPEFLEPITSFECQVLLCTWFYPRGRTSCPSGCWAPRVHLLKMREVSAAGPCIKAESHSQAELSSCGQQASGMAL